MSIHRKIASFAVLQASWISWLLAGFSTGGIGVLLERAITLIRSTARIRKFEARTRRHRTAVGLSTSSLALSSSW